MAASSPPRGEWPIAMSCGKGKRHAAALEFIPDANPVPYLDLYGVADNNPYGLKVYAFLKLSKLAFRHEHILDTKNAPRGQLPYLLDGEKTIGDSDAIISHLIARYALPIDSGLMASQRDTDLLVGRMLDDLYWVMSYSRWKDQRFWPTFRDNFSGRIPTLPTALWQRHGSTISSVTTIKVSDATSPRQFMPWVSRT